MWAETLGDGAVAFAYRPWVRRRSAVPRKTDSCSHLDGYRIGGGDGRVDVVLAVRGGFVHVMLAGPRAASLRSARPGLYKERPYGARARWEEAGQRRLRASIMVKRRLWSVPPSPPPAAPPASSASVQGTVRSWHPPYSQPWLDHAKRWACGAICATRRRDARRSTIQGGRVLCLRVQRVNFRLGSAQTRSRLPP